MLLVLIPSCPIPMNFCTNCVKYLSIREELIDGKRNMSFYCSNCDIKFQCNNYQIEYKMYRHKSKDEFVTMNQHLNPYKSKDITLPMQKTQCPQCKATNWNKFERLYFKNNHQFELNHICTNCYHNWS